MPLDGSQHPTSAPGRERPASMHDRVAHMIHTLHQYRDEINRPGTGSLEFHFRHQALKLKLVQVLQADPGSE